MRRICKIIIVCLVTCVSCEDESDQGERQTSLAMDIPPSLSPLSNHNLENSTNIDDEKKRAADFAPPNDQFVIPIATGQQDKPELADKEDEKKNVPDDKTQSIEDLLEPSDGTPEIPTKVEEVEVTTQITFTTTTTTTTTTETTATVPTTTTTTTTTTQTTITTSLETTTTPPPPTTTTTTPSPKETESLIPMITASLPSPKPMPEISTENADPDNPADPPAFSYAMIGGGIGGVVVIVCLVVVIVVLVKRNNNTTPALGGQDSRRKPKMVQV